MNKFIVVSVECLTPVKLEEQMNDLHKQGYTRVFQSDIQWYQGKGESGIVTFEMKEVQE